MEDFLRMVFGLQTTEKLTIRVEASPDLSKRDLICARSDGKQFVAHAADGVWSIALEPGDYLVSLEAPTWVRGRIEVTFDGREAPRVVRHAMDDSGGDFKVKASAATATSIGNPKDPWPPPLAMTLATAALGASEGWFADRLAAAWKRGVAQLLRSFDAEDAPVLEL